MPRLIDITDPDDARIAPYLNVRERDLVGREQRFIAEGKVVLRVLLKSPFFMAESVLVAANKLPGLGDLLASAPQELPVFVAPQQVIDRVAGFHLHRGILALGRRRGQRSATELVDGLPARARVLALVGISNHDNVGAIFRNAAAFEADAILLDRSCCDPLYRKSIRVSVGGVLTVPFARMESAHDIAALLSGRGMAIHALSPQGETDIADIPAREPVALFLGSEGFGLPAEFLEQVRTLRIDMSTRFDSLNVAAASAIALHRLWRPRD